MTSVHVYLYYQERVDQVAAGMQCAPGQDMMLLVVLLVVHARPRNSSECWVSANICSLYASWSAAWKNFCVFCQLIMDGKPAASPFGCHGWSQVLQMSFVQAVNRNVNGNVNRHVNSNMNRNVNRNVNRECEQQHEQECEQGL